MISYLNCLEYLTLHRDYRPGEVDESERHCEKMYTSLVTQIGGIEVCQSRKFVSTDYRWPTSHIRVGVSFPKVMQFRETNSNTDAVR